MQWRIVQIASGFSPGDAISNEIRIIHRHCLNNGSRLFKSAPRIYAEHIAPELHGEAREAENYRPRPEDVIIYHFSIDGEIFEKIGSLPNPKFIIYHNITPAEYYAPYSLQIAARLARAGRQLERLACNFDCYFAHSETSAADLLRRGCQPVKVVPVLFRGFENSESVRMESRRGGPTLLFVGRIVPNKGFQDLLKIFYYVKLLLPGCHLQLVGLRNPLLRSFQRELERLIAFLDLSDSVFFNDFVTERELDEHYRRADLFLCASHHEGFCVPLLEAMRYDLPVMAYLGESSAVGETLGAAGVGFHEMDHLLAAETAVRILTDRDLRLHVVAGQRKRLELYRPQKILEFILSEVASRLPRSSRL